MQKCEFCKCYDFCGKVSTVVSWVEWRGDQCGLCTVYSMLSWYCNFVNWFSLQFDYFFMLELLVLVHLAIKGQYRWWEWTSGIVLYNSSRQWRGGAKDGPSAQHCCWLSQGSRGGLCWCWWRPRGTSSAHTGCSSWSGPAAPSPHLSFPLKEKRSTNKIQGIFKEKWGKMTQHSINMTISFMFVSRKKSLIVDWHAYMNANRAGHSTIL